MDKTLKSKNMEIPYEIAILSINTIKGLSLQVKKILSKNGISTVGKFLRMEYEKLEKLPGLNSSNLQEIHNVYHPLRNTINNWITTEEKLIEKKNKGYTLLEDCPVEKIYQILYSKNIYTYEELINLKPQEKPMTLSKTLNMKEKN